MRPRPSCSPPIQYPRYALCSGPRLTPLNEKHHQRLRDVGIEDADRLYTRDDLAPGEELLFCATGVTHGRLLEGVRFFGGGHRTSPLFMSLQHKIIRFVDSIRRDDTDSPVLFQ